VCVFRKAKGDVAHTHGTVLLLRRVRLFSCLKKIMRREWGMICKGTAGGGGVETRFGELASWRGKCIEIPGRQ